MFDKILLPIDLNEESSWKNGAAGGGAAGPAKWRGNHRCERDDRP